jgi:hypothetical protein
MKTLKIRYLPEFADWYYTTCLKTVKNYRSDMFYDTRTILNEIQKANRLLEKPIYGVYGLFLRESGTYFVPIEDIDNNLLTAIKSAGCNIAYRLEFCFNSDYMSDEYLCKITDYTF